MRSPRLLALTVAGLLGFATVAVAQLPPGGTFLDDNGSVHEGNIEAIAAADITRGCNPPDNTQFCPDDSVTRGQMAAFLVRAMGYTDDGGGDRFTDDDGSVFEGDIDRLATAGVTLGCNPPDNSRFCPDEPVSRAQMASFLARALGLDPITPPPPTLPENNLCTGSVGAVDLDDTLIVPNGASCDLVGTAIDGNLLVRSGATLTATGVNVIGNIQADGHASVLVEGDSFVDGDIQAEQGSVVTVTDSEVEGSIQLETNSGEITVVRNSVGGDVQVNSNTGGAEIRDNTIGGNLQCQDNDPAPTGGGNDVDGDREEQCSGL
jgi:hypothetical protein